MSPWSGNSSEGAALRHTFLFLPFSRKQVLGRVGLGTGVYVEGATRKLERGHQMGRISKLATPVDNEAQTGWASGRPRGMHPGGWQVHIFCLTPITQ